MRQKAIISIVFSLFVLLLVLPVQATQYVSFAQPDTLTQKDIYLYNASGSLLGLYNTTSTGIELPASGDVMFVIKPQYDSPIDDPGAWLASFLAWTTTNAIALIFSFAIIGFLFVRR
jgi:hypothetical protein